MKDNPLEEKKALYLRTYNTVYEGAKNIRQIPFANMRNQMIAQYIGMNRPLFKKLGELYRELQGEEDEV